jgi:hypothetical protein
MLKYSHEVEIRGQVVGIAMQLDRWHPTTPENESSILAEKGRKARED